MALHHSLFVFLVTLLLGEINSQTTTTAQPRSCTAPPIVSNSNHTTSGLTEGSIAQYTCYPGYEASGSLQKTCRAGLWLSSGPGLSCNVIRCLRPPTVRYGTFRSSSGYSYSVGTVVTYNCYNGYMINGTSADITCQSNRTWTSPLPRCVKKNCGTPPDILGGNVSYTTMDYYSIAVYRCHKGHDLINNGFKVHSGRLNIRCLSTGLWALAPTCRPKTCNIPPKISNGMRFSNGNHKYGDTVSYECNHGYELAGNSTITCTETGSWSVQPECNKVKCGSAPQVRNGTTRMVGKAVFGNSTTYVCSKGFEMTGSPIVSCQADGTWTQLPTCTIVDCRTPPFIHFGTHTWTTTTYKSTAEYRCDIDYKLIGVAKIHCLSTGKWTDSPTCELPPGQTLASAAKQVDGPQEADNSTLTGLAIACALFAVITLLCLCVLIYKMFIAGRTSKLFSYASYKNGDDVVNANI